MKIKTIKLNHCDLWLIHISNDINLCVYFFSIKGWWNKCEVITTPVMGSQITVINFLTLSIQLITPRFVLWLNDKKLIDLAINLLRDRALEIQDYQVDYYLLGNTEYDAEKMADFNAESNVLWNVINFYGGNKDDYRVKD